MATIFLSRGTIQLFSKSILLKGTINVIDDLQNCKMINRNFKQIHITEKKLSHAQRSLHKKYASLSTKENLKASLPYYRSQIIEYTG